MYTIQIYTVLSFHVNSSQWKVKEEENVLFVVCFILSLISTFTSQLLFLKLLFTEPGLWVWIWSHVWLDPVCAHCHSGLQHHMSYYRAFWWVVVHKYILTHSTHSCTCVFHSPWVTSMMGFLMAVLCVCRSPVHVAEAPGGQTQPVLCLPACAPRPPGPHGSCQSSSGRTHHLSNMDLLLFCPQNRLETTS